MQATLRRLKGAVAAAFVAASLTAAPAAAQEVDFSGQTVEWWIPSRKAAVRMSGRVSSPPTCRGICPAIPT